MDRGTGDGACAMNGMPVADDVVQNAVRYADRADAWQAARAASMPEMARNLNKKR